jgi:hypothetical protein
MQGRKISDEDILKLLLEYEKVELDSRGRKDVNTVMLGHAEQ